MNKRPLTIEQSTALEKTQQLFADWRKTKTARARIPDFLWQAAADLYHTRGISINRIVRILGLSHSTLKAKTLDMPPAEIEQAVEDASPLFIEVAAPPICSDCVIEMENQTGVKMRICFRGSADPGVLGLGRYFLAGVP